MFNTQPHRFTCSEEDQYWHLTLMPYLWAASMKGNTTVKGVTAQVDVSFKETLENLDYAIIGQAELQRGRFFILPDTVLLKVGQTVSVDKKSAGKFGLVKTKLEADASADLLMYFQELVGGYRIYERRISAEGQPPRTLAFDLLGGIRNYYIDVDVNAKVKGKITTPIGQRKAERSGKVSGSDNWIDPLIGARIKYDVTNRFSLSVRGNIGGFGVGSDLAWGASALGQYQLTDRWGLVGGYRVLDIDYENGDRGFDARMAGPIIGAQYKLSF